MFSINTYSTTRSTLVESSLDVESQIWRANLGLEHLRIWVYAGDSWGQSPEDKEGVTVLLLVLLFNSVTIFILQRREMWLREVK